MPKSKPLIDAKGEVRELTAADMKRFRPAREVLPGSLLTKVHVRGPQKAPTKERITIRLSPDVVQRFRATGIGWQTRVDAALKDWLESQERAMTRAVRDMAPNSTLIRTRHKTSRRIASR
jgi:uncharacterized protein (DUF4415 family)